MLISLATIIVMCLFLQRFVKWLWKYVFVLNPQMENRTGVWSNALIQVVVVQRPIVIIYLNIENFTAE